MNYTENYHLPQWEENDRVMMTDFNQMCADLEVGLTANAQTAENISQNSDALDKKTLDRLCRLAYNHYSTVQDMDPFPWQVGIFHQNPAEDGSGVTGAKLWKGMCFAARNDAGITQVSLPDYIQQEVELMTLVKDDLAACTTIKINICVPVNCHMNRINLSANIRDNTPDTPFSIRVSLINLDTGETEVSRLVSVSFSLAAGSTGNRRYDCHIPFHAGQHYQLQLQPLEAIFTGNIRLAMDNSAVQFAIISNNQPITAVHTMREHEGSSGGLVIVRGMVFGGELTVQWDGETVPLQSARMIHTPDGRWVREMVYVRSAPTPAETTISLHYDNSVPGSFLFYDWGAVLL